MELGFRLGVPRPAEKGGRSDLSASRRRRNQWLGWLIRQRRLNFEHTSFSAPVLYAKTFFNLNVSLKCQVTLLLHYFSTAREDAFHHMLCRDAIAMMMPSRAWLVRLTRWTRQGQPARLFPSNPAALAEILWTFQYSSL